MFIISAVIFLPFYRRINEQCDRMQDCPPTWWTGEWQNCYNGTRKRSVLCVFTNYSLYGNGTQTVLTDNLCNEIERPKSSDRNCSLLILTKSTVMETNSTEPEG